MAAARARAELTINGRTWKVATVEQLRQRLKAVRAEQFSEVWLRRSDHTSLAILVNRGSAWLTTSATTPGTAFPPATPPTSGPKMR